MGTDTMAYCASALSFMLENLGKPVIITGAMLPLADVLTDARRNLVASIVVASALPVAEVCILINNRLLRGNRTVKVNSAGLDAFDSPNFPPLALLEAGVRFRPRLVLRPPPSNSPPMKAVRRLATSIAVWRMIPGFDDEYVVLSIAKSSLLRAVILELYGTGNLSARKETLIQALSDAVKKGIVVVAASQCLRGAVDLAAYVYLNLYYYYSYMHKYSIPVAISFFP